MSKFLAGSVALATVIGGFALPAAPALAQKKSSEIIVYGTDPCPRATDDEVVICTRRPESQRYRIPEKLREGGSIQAKESWTRRAQEVAAQGKTGIGSCSAVGPAGFTGCTQKAINDAFKERAAQDAEDTAPVK